MMRDPSSISEWLVSYRDTGNEIAAVKLWDRIQPRVKELSRRWIQRSGVTAAYDEDDITISVFAAFCDRLRARQIQDVEDRESLWRLIIVMTARKANDYARAARAKKRLPDQGDPSDRTSVSDVEDKRLTPEMEVLIDDQCATMLRSLGDPELQQAVLLKLEGYSNTEIADRMQLSRRTIQRMLSLVKDIWGRLTDES